jgi:hypothetical protein
VQRRIALADRRCGSEGFIEPFKLNGHESVTTRMPTLIVITKELLVRDAGVAIFTMPAHHTFTMTCARAAALR